jgi:hypothetical protein
MKRIILVISMVALLSSSAVAQSKTSDLMGLGLPPALASAITSGVSASGDHIIGVDEDAQRKYTFGASSDTALTLTFGDATASQRFSISGTTSNASDTQQACISGGGSCGSAGRGSYFFADGADVGGADAGDASIAGTDDIIFYTGTAATTALTIDQAQAITFASTLIGTGTATLGWAVVAGADTACTTTCVTPCVFGVNTASATADIVACSDATADECLCAGAS